MYSDFRIILGSIEKCMMCFSCLWISLIVLNAKATTCILNATLVIYPSSGKWETCSNVIYHFETYNRHNHCMNTVSNKVAKWTTTTTATTEKKTHTPVFSLFIRRPAVTSFSTESGVIFFKPHEHFFPFFSFFRHFIAQQIKMACVENTPGEHSSAVNTNQLMLLKE